MTTQPDEPTNKVDHFKRYATERARLDEIIDALPPGTVVAVDLSQPDEEVRP